MSVPDAAALAERLRRQSGLQGKRDIRAVAAVFRHDPFPALGTAAAIGDDAALLPPVAGSPLLACEALQPSLVEEDPWFAGWSAVLVNVSDIAAMGGRPVAVVNSLWSCGAGHAEPLLAGMRAACDTFDVPMVGGHINQQSPYNALAVAILGEAPGPVLSTRAAKEGDELWLLVNPAGRFHRHYPFWDAATGADPAQLRSHLALLPQLARTRAVRAAKDISMGGLAGTAVMFAEGARLGLEIELHRIPRPPGVDELPWLTCFPSFGFLLAVDPARSGDLVAAITPHADLLGCRIGAFHGPDHGVVLNREGDRARLWAPDQRFTGF